MIYGISVVRDEADIIGLSVRHHLALGLDRVIVIDNGSRDGTTRVLESLEAESRFSWRPIVTCGHRQAGILTALAREAYAEGAAWVLPFDADEFWDTNGERLHDILGNTSAGVLPGPDVNFVQARACTELSSQSLGTMNHRALPHRRGKQLNRALVERGEIAYVGTDPHPKAVTRLTADTSIIMGNHHVSTDADEMRLTDGLRVLHAPLRSRAHLRHKAENGRRVAKVYAAPGIGWHSKRFARLEAEGKLDQEWEANSQRDGQLDLPTGPRRVVRDVSLVDAIGAWL